MTSALTLILAVGLTVFGPLPLLIEGVEALPFVACGAGVAAACCCVSRLTWRRWPGDEWFAVWLFVATVIWTGSGWLGIALVAV